MAGGGCDWCNRLSPRFLFRHLARARVSCFPEHFCFFPRGRNSCLRLASDENEASLLRSCFPSSFPALFFRRRCLGCFASLRTGRRSSSVCSPCPSATAGGGPACIRVFPASWCFGNESGASLRRLFLKPCLLFL